MELGRWVFLPIGSRRAKRDFTRDAPIRIGDAPHRRGRLCEAVEKLFSENWNERNEAVRIFEQFPDQAKELLEKINRAQLNETDR